MAIVANSWDARIWYAGIGICPISSDKCIFAENSDKAITIAIMSSKSAALSIDFLSEKMSIFLTLKSYSS